MAKRKKEIEVSVIVDDSGNATFEFYEPESSDLCRIESTVNDAWDIREKLGGEIASWATLID